MAALALMLAMLTPPLAALARPAPDDPLAALCSSGPIKAGSDPQALPDACVLCVLAHATPAPDDEPAAVATVDYVPPPPAPPVVRPVHPVGRRPARARGPPRRS